MATYEQKNKITYQQISDMKHSVGFNDAHIHGRKYRYLEYTRNYFCAGKSDMERFKYLVDIGLMASRGTNYFIVTQAGKDFLYEVTGVKIM